MKNPKSPKPGKLAVLPTRFAVRLARRLCPKSGWHLDAAVIIDAALEKERARARRKMAAWQRYIEELDGVE